MSNHFDLLIDSFLADKIGIDADFITEELSNGLQQNIRQLLREGKMMQAGIGNSQSKDTHQTMRSDQIYWMDKSHDNVFEQQFLDMVERLIEYLNTTCYTGINGYEFHYAVYEPGSFYKRHKDQFKNEHGRKYSLIHYLNQHWLEEDGGQLRIFQDGESRQIQPEAQTAVFFKSAELEHEVALSHRQRMSVTGWLKCQ